MQRMLARKSQRTGWKTLFRRKMMIAGMCLLALNIVMASLAPYLAWHNPITDMQVADDYAMPEWASALPGCSDLPRNMNMEIRQQEWTVSYSGSNGKAWTSFSRSTELTLQYDQRNTSGPGEATASLMYQFQYQYAPPKTFVIRIPVNITVPDTETVAYRITVTLRRVGDLKGFVIHDSFPPWRSSNYIKWGDLVLILHSRNAALARQAGINPLYQNIATEIFSEKSSYELLINLFLNDKRGAEAPGKLEATFGNVSFRIPGLLYGILGTNNFGADIWSQLVWGARISLIIGVSAAILVVVVGLLVGLTAGYLGGMYDQTLMFLTDTLNQLPHLPIILTIMLVLGRNIYIIVALISILSWMGVARQMRAWVLSLRERPFVEAAVAAGGSRSYIAFHVIAPQLVPVVAYYLAMRVPNAVFLEAGLSLIGFGDPYFPSWGKILNEAYNFGGFSKLAWWWIAPPITAILLLALGFVLIGYTLEEVFHPRLRRR